MLKIVLTWSSKQSVSSWWYNSVCWFIYSRVIFLGTTSFLFFYSIFSYICIRGHYGNIGWWGQYPCLSFWNTISANKQKNQKHIYRCAYKLKGEKSEIWTNIHWRTKFSQFRPQQNIRISLLLLFHGSYISSVFGFILAWQDETLFTQLQSLSQMSTGIFVLSFFFFLFRISRDALYSAIKTLYIWLKLALRRKTDFPEYHLILISLVVGGRHELWG